MDTQPILWNASIANNAVKHFFRLPVFSMLHPFLGCSDPMCIDCYHDNGLIACPGLAFVLLFCRQPCQRGLSLFFRLDNWGQVRKLGGHPV